MEAQTIRFADRDGSRVAWSRSGSGPPLVFSGWWMSHLELNWRDPAFRSFVEALGRHRTVVRYDAPGTGLSPGGPAPADVEGEVAALGAVVEASGSEPVDLLAASSGAPVGIAFAATAPERVRRLVVYGGYASGPAIADARSRRATIELVREHWGLGSRALTDVFLPGADTREREAFVEFQREAADAEQAARALEAVYRFDVSTSLAHVSTPTVVLHRREDRAIPFALGRELAAALPDASFVPLAGADHFPWAGDSDELLRAMLAALGVDRTSAAMAGQDADRPPAADPAPAEQPELSARETEVLALIADGLSDREIAERLVLSPHTVHRHVANARTKLGLPTRAAAVAAAARRGLL